MKRYDHSIRFSNSGSAFSYMEESDSGDFILHSDYLAQRKLDRLAVLEDLLHISQNPALTGEGVRALISVMKTNIEKEPR